MTSMDDSRLRALNEAPVRKEGDHVLYWMTAYRRPVHNFALEHAVARARELDVPLIVLEALRVGYPWASDRLHRFVIDGMAHNAAFFEKRAVAHHPYVEPEEGAGKGLLASLSEDACLVVTDDWPCFFLPRMQEAAADALEVRLEAVDGNGLVPIHRADKAFARAYDFRRYLHSVLEEELERWPAPDPTDDAELKRASIPDDILERWPAASEALLGGDEGALASLPIDHDVAPVGYRGGHGAARERLEAFLDGPIDDYDERSHPDADVASGLSPWLHFGHIGTHEILAAIADREGWSPAEVEPETNGKRIGFWGMSEPLEGFMDELVTWRELGFNACVQLPDYDRYESLPDWARKTLREHEDDPREPYDFETLERAETSDELWNAAQRQLLEEGRIQNYMRMLWGKKILEWAPSPRRAAEWMIHLNDKYAVDGRDPNSYSGIFWTLGRYDRAWGPEREIFGKIRYMTSQSARRKLRLKEYLERWGSVD